MLKDKSHILHTGIYRVAVVHCINTQKQDKNNRSMLSPFIHTTNTYHHTMSADYYFYTLRRRRREGKGGRGGGNGVCLTYSSSTSGMFLSRIPATSLITPRE